MWRASRGAGSMSAIGNSYQREDSVDVTGGIVDQLVQLLSDNPSGDLD